MRQDIQKIINQYLDEESQKITESTVMLWGNYKLFQVNGLGKFSSGSDLEKTEIIKQQLLSVSRYYQNPLNETLSLWNSQIS